jgi:predicted ABC-type ATPase
MSNVTSSPSNSRVIERTPRTITLPVSGQILHVSVEAPDLSVARVGERIKEGGHDVPEEKFASVSIKMVRSLSRLQC